MTVPMPKKRGRPRKNPLPPTVAEVKRKEMTDEQLLEMILEHFNGMREMMDAMVKGINRAMIVSGAPGIGKTYTINQILEHAENKKQIKFTKTSGYMTALMLFKLLSENRGENDITMIDDCDSIFYDDDAVNLLKAALDTNDKRIISFKSMALNRGADEGDEVEDEFEYKGRIIFVTNIDFNAFLEAGRNKMTPHIEALRDRCFYFDMKLHGERAVALWIRHMVQGNKMLMGHPHGLSKEQSDTVLEWLLANRARIPVLSLRTAVKAAGLVRINPKGWTRLADMTLTK